MKAPAKRYLSFVNCILRNFPNRDELLFRSVFALPNDSRMGEESTTFFSKPVTPPFDRRVKYLELFSTEKKKMSLYFNDDGNDDASNSNRTRRGSNATAFTSNHGPSASNAREGK